jgi:hypothetical protein
MAAKKNIRAGKADDITDVPIPPHEQVINLIFLLGIIQEFQYYRKNVPSLSTYQICKIQMMTTGKNEAKTVNSGLQWSFPGSIGCSLNNVHTWVAM